LIQVNGREKQKPSQTGMNDPDDLGIADTSWLTDADWAIIDGLRRIHETEGQKAVRDALRALEPKATFA
jgi:hypothetical protein